jgi:hypothetical protein
MPMDFNHISCEKNVNMFMWRATKIVLRVTR